MKSNWSLLSWGHLGCDAGYEQFEGPCCLHLQGAVIASREKGGNFTVKMKAACSYETLVSYRNTTRNHSDLNLRLRFLNWFLWIRFADT